MAPADAAPLAATVVCAAGGRVWERAVRLPAGSTLADAVAASGLLDEVPGLTAQALDLGVFNRPRAPGTALRDGDRVEIYRPLTVDPKEARRVRAEVRRRRKAAGR
jgi:putative ubiquitin-RnfH superfamily antitoxin RatB of RatAB toxin-antitoxin module